MRREAAGGGRPGLKLFLFSSPSRSCRARLPKAQAEKAAIMEGGGRWRSSVWGLTVPPGEQGLGRGPGFEGAFGVAVVEQLCLGLGGNRPRGARQVNARRRGKSR